MKTLTHDLLVDRAGRWLRSKQGCRPVFLEMTTAASTTPDAIGWCRGASRLIEVKMSRSDFFADRRKLAHRLDDYAMGQRRWYLVPEGLVRPDDLPPEWGLLYAKGNRILEIVEAPLRVVRPTAQAQEGKILTSAFFRLRAGALFFEAKGRWESYMDHKARRLGSGSNLPGNETQPEASERFLGGDGALLADVDPSGGSE